MLPDPTWFFGLEDFDFFCRVREAGFEVLVDAVAARAGGGPADQPRAGRSHSADRRPTDAGRGVAVPTTTPRNSFALARRHGRPSWYAWHLAYSVRQLQKATSRPQRVAIAHGLWDGARGRMGEHVRYRRRVGEFGTAPPSPPDRSGVPG